jgi:hypothetical protein
MATAKKDNGTKRREPTVLSGIANYLYCFKPRKDPEDKDAEGLYQCVLSWSKDDEKQTETLENLVEDVAVEQWGAKAKDLLARGKIQSPLRDGDDSDDENFHDCWMVNSRRKESLGRPGVVDQDVQPILDQTEIYSGCSVNISVNLYAYDYKGKKGVGVGLNNIQKVADGERRGGGTRAEDDFQPLASKRRSTSRRRRQDEDDDDRPY